MRLILLAILLLAGSGHVQAAVALGGLFRDHAVLQRDLPLRIWGTAPPGCAVQVCYAEPSGLRRCTSATAAADGRWEAALDPLPACARPGTLTACGPSGSATAQDVLVGEVWLASGQSNMQHPFIDAGLKDAIEGIDTPLVRMFRIATDHDARPRPDFNRDFAWGVCRGRSLLWMSVVAYHFAARLQRELGVPVGVVQAAYAGTSIHAWMSPAALAAAAPHGQRLIEAHAGRPLSQATPSSCWNAMIHPTLRYARRGVIWYQGENNVADPEAYAVLFPALIRAWRQEQTQAAQGSAGGAVRGEHRRMRSAAGCPDGQPWARAEGGARSAGRAAPGDGTTPGTAGAGAGEAGAPAAGGRSRWDSGDEAMPFLFVQLAGWNTGDPKADWPGLRSVQAGALALPGTGMAVTIDIGNPGQIHPPDKDIVGDRLARIALRRTYGRAEVIDTGPVVERVEAPGDGSLVLRFAGCGGGLSCRRPLKAFRLGAADGPLLPVTGAIGQDGTSIVLRHPQIPAPARASYAWDNPAWDATLAGGHGLPVAPFRASLSATAAR